MKRKIKEVIDFIQDCGALRDGGLCIYSCSNDYLAELLVANNVVKLPARIGSKVYGVSTPCGGCEQYSEDSKCVTCSKAQVTAIEFDWELVTEWGKEVFATQEEAEEAATRKRGANNDGDKKDS